MAKRFTDTDKWNKPWFRKLAPRWKLAWFYICDNCDHAGVWPADFELMSFRVGEKIKEEDFVRELGSKLDRLKDGKFFIRPFVDFQYGSLNPQNNAHKGVLRVLEKLAPTQGLGGTLKGAQEKEEEKEQEQEKEKGGAKRETKSATHTLVEIWNSNRGPLPAVRGCSGTRMKQARARWDENPSPEYWAEIVTRLAASPFCSGKNDRLWKADFDFLIKPDTQHRVLEGKYDGKLSTHSQPGLTAEELERLSDIGGVL